MAERFLSRLEIVLQSYEQFTIDGTLEIHITHVVVPLGGKIPKTKYIYVDLDRFLRNSALFKSLTKVTYAVPELL